MRSELTVKELAAVLGRHPTPPRYRVAFSGGLDSTVLLHACCALRVSDSSDEFTAVHVHHGLQSEADAWMAHCAALCARWAIPFDVRYVEARPAPGESPEEAARNARYRALAQILGPGDTLLSGQHADDQVETLLLQLLRGAGLAGLAAMPARSSLGKGFLCRPLLEFSRQSLRDYAERNGLTWIEDRSNADLRYARNYLRHEIVPRLASRWPGITAALCRTAEHCAEAGALITELGDELLQTVRDPARNTLLIDRLSDLSAARRRLALRQWLAISGCRMPSTAIIERVLNEICLAGADRQPVVWWTDAEIRRFRGELYLLRRTTPFDANGVLSWDGESPLPLNPNNGCLTASGVPSDGIDPMRWAEAPITVRYRRGGEKLRLARHDGRQDLKKLLQHAGIPPWIRQRLPLIYVGTELAAVADLWICEEFAGDPVGVNVRIEWQPPALAIGAEPTNAEIRSA